MSPDRNPGFVPWTAGRHFYGRLVEDCVLLELKAARALDPSHQAQLLNYLRATEIEVGLLLNFGLKPDFKRLIFDNPRKLMRGKPGISIADVLIADDKI